MGTLCLISPGKSAERFFLGMICYFSCFKLDTRAKHVGLMVRLNKVFTILNHWQVRVQKREIKRLRMNVAKLIVYTN